MQKCFEKSWILGWGVVACGYGFLAFALFLLDSVITQPHAVYVTGTWLTHATWNAFRFSWWFTLGIAAVVPIDLLVQRERRGATSPDFCFHPTVRGLRRAISSPLPGLVLLSSFVLLAAYYVHIEVTMWRINQRPHGLIWPPHWLFVISVLLWGMLWVADCIRRPAGGTIIGAIVFTGWAAVCSVPIAFGCLVE